MSSVELVTATPKIVKKFYKGPPCKTIKAIAGVKGEEVLGIGGYYLTKESIVIFSEVTPEGMKKKKSIVKGARKVLEMAKKTGLPIFAIRDPNIETSCKFLMKLGFQEVGNGVYIWHS